MNPQLPKVPVLPESAPFTPEQRAWLNGYLAGLFSWTSAAPAAPPAQDAGIPLTILFGSQTGGAEKAAKQLAKKASARGFAVTLRDMADTSPQDLTAASRLCVIASTYGDGEPPDRAKDFWRALCNGAPRMESTRFSVLALGDSNYPKFCEFGRSLDRRLAELGASRLVERRDCDGEWATDFQEWSSLVLQAMAGGDAGTGPEAEAEAEPQPAEIHAPVLRNVRLSAPASAKEVRHCEFSLASSGLRYACGDALSVRPQNDPALVEAILAAGGFSGDENVTRKGRSLPLHEVLLKEAEISRVPPVEGIEPGWREGRDVLDWLQAGTRITAEELNAKLKDLKPRLYSISSSPAAHGDNVHVTVSAVRWESHGRKRHGVCSTYIADRLAEGDTASVRIHENPAFRPPAGDVPLIMIGPGTGIAPFRGFLHERRATGSRGLNWLFFGDQYAATDFLYREELEQFQADGILTHLDLAWSRQGPEKVYVQHRMLQNAAKLWSWLDQGAAIYVCGDASRMARDVEAALLEILQQAGGKSSEAAMEMLGEMKRTRRYCRDVY